jgi:hypothetical protein
MGGLKSPILAVAAALFALFAGAPAPAAADSPVDPAAVVQTVKQSAGVNKAAPAASAVQETTSLAQGAADTPPPAIRETVDRVAGRTRQVRGPSADLTRPAVPAHPAAHARAAPERPVAGGRSSHDRRFAPADRRRRASTSSPPRGQEATPPARSAPEGAVGSRPASHPTSAVPAPDGVPGGAGTTIGAGSLLVPNAIFFVALLIVALVVSRSLDLRSLQVPVPAWRRLAFVTPAVPPG